MANSVKVKYYDPSGKAREGYIIDNKTYKDPDGNERVDIGSVVETAGGTYTLTKNGGVKTNFLQENYDRAEEQLSSAKRAAADALERKYKSLVYEIENNKRSTKKNYNEAIADNNQQKELSQKKLNQLLKAQGISGGASESSIIANAILFEEKNNELTRDYNKTISDYDLMLLNLANEKEHEILKSNSEYDTLYADLLSKRANAQNEALFDELSLYSQNYRFNSEEERKSNESQRDYERKIYEDERDYNRNVFESDRQFAFDYETDKRDYDRAVYEDDRDYNRGVYEDERDYSRGVYENNRSYNLSSSKYNSSLQKDDYQKRLKDAEIRAKGGDYSGYAELFGWSDEKMREIAGNIQ